MGLIAAVVYAHDHHCQNMDNPGNIGDCMKRRIRFTTAITRAFAHAYQVAFLTRHIPAVQSQRFCLPSASASNLHLPTVVPQHAKEAMISRCGPSTLTEGTRLADGSTLAGWSAVARSSYLMDRCLVCPVITTEAHLAFVGARVHSNCTSEMSAIDEALSFLGPHGPVARDACYCVFYDSQHAAVYCLGTILPRTHVQLGLSCQQLSLKVQHRLRFTMQHVYSHAQNLQGEKKVLFLLVIDELSSFERIECRTLEFS